MTAIIAPAAPPGDVQAGDAPAAPTPSDPSVPVLAPVLEGISWKTYESLLNEVAAAGQKVWITYDRGRMTIVSPLPIHESWKHMLGWMIQIIALELDIPIRGLGSTTWRREEVGRGLEADECYYVRHEPQIRGRTDIDLARDPPPDLAVEVEVTHHPNPIDRQAVYAALGVPELWRYDGARLTTLLLQGDGTYRPSPVSLAFPFLRPSDLERFLAMVPEAGETALMRAFRDWVRTDLAPAAGRQG